MPRGGPMGRGGNPTDKAKDFKGAMKRLFSELKPFRILVYIALILAVLGSIMSIIAPNKLSTLTDEISEGLVINTDNLKTITDTITSSLNEENMQSKIEEILSMNLSEDTITQIMMSSEISEEDKQEFQTVMAKMQESEASNNGMSYISELPDSILQVILPETSYHDIEISTEDKIEFLKAIGSLETGEVKEDAISSIPENIKKALLDEIEIDGTKISSEDQIKFIELMSSMTDETELYSKIDEMPKSIQDVIEPFMDMDAIKKIALILASLYTASAIFTFIQSI